MLRCNTVERSECIWRIARNLGASGEQNICAETEGVKVKELELMCEGPCILSA